MKRLKELRLQRGLYQKDVAGILGVDRTTYNKYECGTSEPSNTILAKLADFFEVSVDELLGRDIDQTKSQPDAIIDDGLRNEIVRIFDGLSGSGREQALSYLRFLAADADRKADP